MAEQHERRLRHDSDALLDEIEALRAMEREKRTYQISTPEFHDLADAITEKSREIFAIAADERATGNRIDERQAETTDDVEP